MLTYQRKNCVIFRQQISCHRCHYHCRDIRRFRYLVNRFNIDRTRFDNRFDSKNYFFRSFYHHHDKFSENYDSMIDNLIDFVVNNLIYCHRMNYCSVVKMTANLTNFDLLNQYRRVVTATIEIWKIDLRMTDLDQLDLIDKKICFDTLRRKNVVVAIDKYDFEIDRK